MESPVSMVLIRTVSLSTLYIQWEKVICCISNQEHNLEAVNGPQRNVFIGEDPAQAQWSKFAKQNWVVCMQTLQGCLCFRQ